jgi:hypothetical protein
MGAFARQRARFQRDLASKFSKGCGAAVTLVTEGTRDTKPNRGRPLACRSRLSSAASKEGEPVR